MRIALALLVTCIAAGQLVAQPTNNSLTVIDPVSYMQARLKAIGCNPPITYATNATVAFCTVHCRDLKERQAVYAAFRSSPKVAMSMTREPPTVCVALVFDPSRYQEHQFSLALDANLQNSLTPIRGKVLQKNKDGLLVTCGDHTVLVIDGPGLIDDDPISVEAYWVGTYEYTSPSNALKTVRKYTCDEKVAADYWTPFSAAKAQRETGRRAPSL